MVYISCTLEKRKGDVKNWYWQASLGIGLLLLSAVLYAFHYMVFHDLHHIFIYLMGDIAFVPIEVLMVTLIIHRLLDKREKQALINKLNMVIEVFFNEVGTPLLERLSGFVRDFDNMSDGLIVDKHWKDAEFNRAGAMFCNDTCQMDSRRNDLAELKSFLGGRRDFLLRLLENPNLLEHEAFTDLLWAVFHLADELNHRADLDGLPEGDYMHLSGDMKRAYVLLVQQWLLYLNHTRREYPYLFSIAIRTNPLNPQADIHVAD